METDRTAAVFEYKGGSKLQKENRLDHNTTPASGSDLS